MNSITLNEFVKKVMNINADYAGMGGASAAIIGASSTNHSVIHDLRQNVITFASEYSKDVADPKLLEQFSEQLEGSFLALKMVNAISNERLAELSSNLGDLLSANNI